MQAVRVLLVDDEVEFAEPLARRLESRGFATTIATSGDAALERFGNEDFDVVLLDLVMPGRDGLETLREIKSRDPLAEVIMLSGRGSEETAIDGMKRGAFDFLAKPLDIGDLVEKINGAHAKRAEHLDRIRSAVDAGQDEDAAVEQVAATETSEAAHTAGDGTPRHGRLLVLGRESEFSKTLIDYAIEMAERLSYEVLALNAAGFSNEALRSFPSAREKVCEDFRIASEENVVPFQEEAAKKGIPFSHMVTFSGLDEATHAIQQDGREIDFVVSEAVDGLLDAGVGPDILVYAPA